MCLKKGKKELSLEQQLQAKRKETTQISRVSLVMTLAAHVPSPRSLVPFHPSHKKTPKIRKKSFCGNREKAAEYVFGPTIFPKKFDPGTLHSGSLVHPWCRKG
ncbi:hypothetical protein AVEN_181565-1 [Araneus ventricosus]|uniref:Uncharacterized protein n=1 Tax=Araneus ventricosus TaxID=182803 RepID=A0A4Y2E6F7_ARAVE|nr:hypothetical protein AVEN_181565-1 [Araneus ventricosus]